MLTEELIQNACGTTDRLALLLRGGGVRRYHAHPGIAPQSVAEHSWRVAVLCAYLWPDRPQLVTAALYHDVAEGLFGDLPAPAKRALPPAAADALAEIETEYERYLGIERHAGSLCVEDYRRLKIADYTELCLHVYEKNTEDERLVFRNGVGYVGKLLAKLERGERERICDLLEPRFDISFYEQAPTKPTGQEHPFGYDAAAEQHDPDARAGFDLGAGRVTRGTRFELLEFLREPYQREAKAHPTGRYGYVVTVQQDGDASVEMDDGLAPHRVKWNRIRRVG